MSDRIYLNTIKILSAVIPLVVAILLYLPSKMEMGNWVYTLPHSNAMVNTLTCVFLVIGVVAIKKGNIHLHRLSMSTCFVLGSIFLVSYVAYHASVDSVKYGDTNSNGILEAAELAAVSVSRNVYLFVLLTHILLSLVVVPLVLLSFYYSLSGYIEKHKKIVKWTFPIWLYVSLTGVIVYLMIRPYYLY